MDTTQKQPQANDSLLETMLSSLEPLVNSPQNQADPYAALDPDSIFALAPQTPTGSNSHQPSSPYIAVKPGDTFLQPQNQEPSPQPKAAEQPLPPAPPQQSPHPTPFTFAATTVTEPSPAPPNVSTQSFVPLVTTTPAEPLPSTEPSPVFPSPLKATEINTTNHAATTIPTQTAPPQPRVKDSSEKKRRSHSSEKKKTSRSWLLPLAILLGLLLLAALLFGLSRLFEKEKVTPPVTTKAPQESIKQSLPIATKSPPLPKLSKNSAYRKLRKAS